MKSIVSAIAFAIFFISSSAVADSPNVNSTIEDRYPGPWKTEFNMAITKTLSKNGARGCGIIKYRESAKDKNEFLAVCSTDNKNWDAYMVWPNINEMMGPYTLN